MMAGARRSGRRRASANELVTIFWRDIPAQVTATHEGTKGSWLLDERFQVAIDRAATIAGLTTTDDYVKEWRRETEALSGDPQVEARIRAEQLAKKYPPERVRSIAENGGLEKTPTSPPHQNSQTPTTQDTQESP